MKKERVQEIQEEINRRSFSFPSLFISFLQFTQTASEPRRVDGMKGASAESGKNKSDAETSSA